MMRRFRDLAARWLGNFGAGSVNRKLLSAATTVAVATLFVKALAAAKELFVAFRLGTAPELDAFLLAYVLPSFAMGVVTGALQSAFVPTYLELSRQGGQKAAAQLAGSFATLLLGLLTVAALILTPVFSVAIPTLARGFEEPTIQLTRGFLYLLMPTFVLGGMAGFWSAVLNADQRFMTVAMVPVITPVAIALMISLAWPLVGSAGLVVGTLAGSAFELLVLCLVAYSSGFRIQGSAGAYGGVFRSIAGQFLPAATSSLLMGGTLIIDQAMAAALTPGSVATLNFGTRMTLMLVGVGTMALATAALPYFSQMVADHDWQGVRNTLRTYTRLVLVVTIPLTLLLVAVALPLTRLLFERGAFTADDTQRVAMVHALAALQMPFYTWSMLVVRLLASLKASAFLMWGAAISLALKVVLNMVFASWLGVAGIALATSVVYAVSCVYFLLVLRRRLPQFGDRRNGGLPA